MRRFKSGRMHPQSSIRGVLRTTFESLEILPRRLSPAEHLPMRGHPLLPRRPRSHHRELLWRLTLRQVLPLALLQQPLRRMPRSHRRARNLGTPGRGSQCTFRRQEHDDFKLLRGGTVQGLKAYLTYAPLASAVLMPRHANHASNLLRPTRSTDLHKHFTSK